MAKKIQKLAFSWNLTGHGVLNYNGSNGNETFAKFNRYDDKDVLKTSRDCLMHEMFEDEQAFHSPYCNDQISREMFVSYLVTRHAAIRGYLKAAPKGSGQESLTRTSIFSSSDAELINDAKVTMETFSRSGERNDVSFFAKQTVGKTMWHMVGEIDFSLLQFVSCESRFSNAGLDVNLYNLFKEKSEAYCGRIPFKRGYYTKTTSLVPALDARDGLHYDDQWVKDCLKDIIGHMLDINATRAKAHAHNYELKIAPIYRGSDASIIDREDDEKWITLTVDNYESIIDGLDLLDHYQEVDENDVFKTEPVKKEKAKKAKNGKPQNEDTDA